MDDTSERGRFIFFFNILERLLDYLNSSSIHFLLLLPSSLSSHYAYQLLSTSLCHLQSQVSVRLPQILFISLIIILNFKNPTKCSSWFCSRFHIPRQPRSPRYAWSEQSNYTANCWIYSCFISGVKWCVSGGFFYAKSAGDSGIY